MAPGGSQDLLKVLANPTNRAILGILALEPQYPRRLAEIVGLTEDEASRRLRQFEKAGLVAGAWAHLGKNVRLYSLRTNRFTVQVDAAGLVVEGVAGRAALHVGPAEGAAPATQRFRGRGRHLEEVDRHLASRSACCIVGIGGTGKTALAAAYAARSGLPVLWHTIAQGESGAVLLGRVAAAQRSRDAGERQQALLDLGRADDEGALRQVLLESLSATKTLVVLDRFEAAAPTAGEEVRTWLDGLGDARLIITARAFPTGVPRGPVPAVRLEGLDPDDAVEVLGAYGAKIGPAAARELHRRTGGHALSLVLVAQSADPSAPPERLLQDAGIQEFFVEDVLPQLPDNDRDVLLATSVLRLPFTAEEAHAVSENRHAAHALLRLEARGLATATGAMYVLHDLVREFALRAAPVPRLLHGRAAKALAASGEPLKVLEAIHHHLEAGAPAEAAKLVHQEAVERTFRFLDLGLADRYRGVLERLAADPRLPPQGASAVYIELAYLDTFEARPSEAEAWLARARADGDLAWGHTMARARLLRLGGKLDEASAAFREAGEAAGHDGDDRRHVEALIERGFLEEERSDAAAIEIYRGAVTVAERLGDPLLLSLAYAGGARISMRMGQDRDRGWAREALRLARLAGSLRGEASAYMTLTTHAMMQGQTSTGLEYSQRYLEVARRLGDPWLQACALSDRALLLIATQQYQDGLDAGRAVQKLARAIRSPFYEYCSKVIEAEAHLGLDHPDAALRSMRKGSALESGTWPAMAARGWNVQAQALQMLGRTAEARKARARARELAASSGPGDPTVSMVPGTSPLPATVPRRRRTRAS